MTRYYLQTKKTSLSYGISDTETTMRLAGLYKLDGTSLSAADIGDYLTGTFDPGTSKEEIFAISSSGVTVNADGTVDITGVIRGLREGGTAGYSTGGYSAEHGAGAVVVISNNPQLYDQFANKGNDNTFSGLNIFNGYAPQTNTDPVAGNDMTRLSYVQSLILGTLTTINLILPGTAGETIAAGQLVYLKSSDNRWWLADADTASTVNNVQLGIAQGAGTAGTSILNGIMTQGVDIHQTGLTGGQIQYASNTAGAISNTPGTIEVTVGIAKSATELMLSPRFDQQLTEDQQDALIGTTGIPSLTNKFVTDTDTRLIQPYFGDGSDGTVTFDGTTTILGIVPSSSIYTMTRDIHCINMTVNTGVTIKPSGYKIFATGTFTMLGTATISRNGNNGSNGGVGSMGVQGTGGAGGAALAAGTLDGSLAGGAGQISVQSGGPAQPGVPAAPGASVSNSIGSSGAAGGGSNGSGGGASPSAGGTATSSVTRLTKGWNLQSLLDITTSGTATRFTNSAASTGGGSGASSAIAGANGGGGGGAGSSGGIIAIYAYSIVISASSVISVIGGNGGNGATGLNGTGGGGGGGNGGIVIFVYVTLSNLGTVLLTGGTAGTSGGTAATNGSTGLLKQFAII